MFDITTTRGIAVQAHPPLTIFLMLFGMALGCAALTGYGMARIPQPSPVHMLGFAAATALTFYIILDIGDSALRIHPPRCGEPAAL